MSISMKWGLLVLILDPNSEKIEGFYKTDNFNNDIVESGYSAV